MTYELPEKFEKYVCAGKVSPNIPDELLKELKEFNEQLKKADGREHLHFPR
jgi:hypothetical protein